MKEPSSFKRCIPGTVWHHVQKMNNGDTTKQPDTKLHAKLKKRILIK